MTPVQSPRRPGWGAVGWLLLLGPLFFLVYGWCNAFTSHRPDVGSFFFQWEKRIPFVPAMIVPYLSIDLFFAGSFFLCRDRATLRAHALRIFLAIVISAVGFLVFPLRYGITRPAVTGWLGALFAPLNALDQPYNLFPSLHISLRSILWRVYSGSTRAKPWLWMATGTWFFLIGVSTLLVYQHHVIDLLGGYLVALLCFRLTRERAAGKPLPSGRPGNSLRPSGLLHEGVAAFLAALVKPIIGNNVRWIGCRPGTRQRIYFANHTSHLDAVVLWAALGPASRRLTRPVAACDYWLANPFRRYFATRVFRSVLVDRRHMSANASDPLEPLFAALADGRTSLILFPEGTRGTGPEAGPFKSGLYNLGKRRPDVELVPVRIENMCRILPKGRRLPVPMRGGLIFGEPLSIQPEELQWEFLARARAAVNGLRRAAPVPISAL